MSLKIKALALVLVILLCLSPNANAVLGVGDIVFDPAALAEALRQTIQMIDTVDMLRRQYQHMLEMARGLPLPFMFTDWYAPIWTPWLSAWPLSDVYQLNNTWARALHGSQEFEQGYRTATEALDIYGPELESILDDVGSSRLKRRYTGVELQDGSNVHALHLIGKVSLHSTMTERKVSNLEEVIFSADPELHTEMAELEKLNISNVITLRAISDTNKLLAASLEQDLVESRSRREAEAQEINRHIDYLRRAPEVHRTLSGSVTNTLNSFRMP